MLKEYAIIFSSINEWQVELDLFMENIKAAKELDNLTATDIYVILEELVSNYFKYALKPEYTQMASVKLAILESVVELSITYDGDDFNPFGYISQKSEDVAFANIGGKGIDMVKSLAQNYYYQRNNKTIILSLTKYRNMETEMTIGENEYEDVTVLSLEGRLDIMSSDGLQKKFDEVIDEKQRKQIVVDCRQLSFISSAGLRLFMIALKKLNKMNGKISFCSFNLNNRKIFEITGYDKFFSIYDTLDEALQAFKE